MSRAKRARKAIPQAEDAQWDWDADEDGDGGEADGDDEYVPHKGGKKRPPPAAGRRKGDDREKEKEKEKDAPPPTIAEGAALFWAPDPAPRLGGPPPPRQLAGAETLLRALSPRWARQSTEVPAVLAYWHQQQACEAPGPFAARFKALLLRHFQTATPAKHTLFDYAAPRFAATGAAQCALLAPLVKLVARGRAVHTHSRVFEEGLARHLYPRDEPALELASMLLAANKEPCREWLAALLSGCSPEVRARVCELAVQPSQSAQLPTLADALPTAALAQAVLALPDPLPRALVEALPAAVGVALVPRLADSDLLSAVRPSAPFVLQALQLAPHLLQTRPWLPFEVEPCARLQGPQPLLEQLWASAPPPSAAAAVGLCGPSPVPLPPGLRRVAMGRAVVAEDAPAVLRQLLWRGCSDPELAAALLSAADPAQLRPVAAEAALLARDVHSAPELFLPSAFPSSQASAAERERMAGQLLSVLL